MQIGIKLSACCHTLFSEVSQLGFDRRGIESPEHTTEVGLEQPPPPRGARKRRRKNDSIQGYFKSRYNIIFRGVKPPTKMHTHTHLCTTWQGRK